MTKIAILKRFLAAEDGATAIEYGLIAALVSVAAITALGALGGSLDELFVEVSTRIESSIPAPAEEG